jgi:hypothetical protein
MTADAPRTAADRLLEALDSPERRDLLRQMVAEVQAEAAAEPLALLRALVEEWDAAVNRRPTLDGILNLRAARAYLDKRAGG